MPLLNPRPPELSSVSSFRTLIVLGSPSEVSFGEGYKDPAPQMWLFVSSFRCGRSSSGGVGVEVYKGNLLIHFGPSLLALDTSSQSLCVSQARCTVRF